MFGSGSYDDLRLCKKGWIKEYLGDGLKVRQDEWTESVAVGSRTFIEKVKTIMGYRAMGRDVLEGAGGYHFREGIAPYKALFGAKKNDIGPKNTFSWNINYE